MNTSRETLKILAGVHSPNCISIYINAGDLGAPISGTQSKITFKNKLAEAGEDLASRGTDQSEIDRILGPGHELLEDGGFWEGLDPGLAVFLCDGKLNTLGLHKPVKPILYIADHLYILPLIPELQKESRYFLLSLSLGDADLFVGDQSGLSEIALEDLGAQSLEEALGADYKQKFLQFRAGQTGEAGGAVFHGHGEGKDDHKEEIVAYFRHINRSLAEVLRHETAPLLVACVDYLMPMYQEVNTYPHIHSHHIPGHPGRDSRESLHQRATELLEPIFSKTETSKKSAFLEQYATDKTSWETAHILQLAITGKIDTVFFRHGADQYGIYDQAAGGLKTEDAKTHSNASVFNMIARHTFENGGNVFILPEEEMPLSDQEVCALSK
jgi:hypothetical protein